LDVKQRSLKNKNTALWDEKATGYLVYRSLWDENATGEYLICNALGY
jgi:hypothetical protein